MNAYQNRRLKIAVVGASGFVGNRIATLAQRNGHTVVGIIRNLATYRGILSEHALLQWDVCGEPDSNLENLSDFDLMIYCAAIKMCGLDTNLLTASFSTNTLGALRAAKLASTLNISRFLLLSAGNAYQKPENNLAADESTPIATNSPAIGYLSSLLSAETLVKAALGDTSTKLCIFRPTSIFGPCQRLHNVVAKFVSILKSEGVIKLENEGKFTADLVFVDDIYHAMLCAFDSQVSGTYNIGSSKLTTMLELAQIVIECMKASKRQLDLLPAQTATPSYLSYPKVSTRRACEDFGFVPTNLTLAVEKTVFEQISANPMETGSMNISNQISALI